MAEQEWKDQVITTGVDKLMEYLRNEREVRVDEAAQSLEVEPDTVITWAKSLQDSGLAELRYTARRGRIISVVDDETKPEAVMDEMKEDMSADIEELTDIGREQARLDRFQDILDRLNTYLEKDEDFIEDLVEERDEITEDLDEITSFVEDLDTVEHDVDTLQTHLDTLKQDIEVLTELDRLKQEHVETDDTDTEADDGDSMSPLYPLKKLAAMVPSLHGRSRSGIACDVCGKAFDTEQGLSTHRTVTGHYETEDDEEAGETETFKCPECDRSFDSQRGVRTHIGMKHSTDNTDMEAGDT